LNGPHASNLTLTEVAQQIEAGARDVSYGELREIATVLGTSVAALALRIEEIVAAKDQAAGRARKKR
jgi:hypothetical protein